MSTRKSAADVSELTPIPLRGGILLTTIKGAFQMRLDHLTSEKGILDLMALILANLPLFRLFYKKDAPMTPYRLTPALWGVRSQYRPG